MQTTVDHIKGENDRLRTEAKRQQEIFDDKLQRAEQEAARTFLNKLRSDETAFKLAI